MQILKNTRETQKLSQRRMAQKAKISYKALQLIEQGNDSRLSTLTKITSAFGYQPTDWKNYIEKFFVIHPQSLFFAALSISQDGFDSWKIHFFDFVDQFRKSPSSHKIKIPPLFLEEKLETLLTSTVESLCDEFSLPVPSWCVGIFALKQPWFVSGVESLKATSLMESPLYFRKRNIYVLANFLERF